MVDIWIYVVFTDIKQIWNKLESCCEGQKAHKQTIKIWSASFILCIFQISFCQIMLPMVSKSASADFWPCEWMNEVWQWTKSQEAIVCSSRRAARRDLTCDSDDTDEDNQCVTNITDKEAWGSRKRDKLGGTGHLGVNNQGMSRFFLAFHLNFLQFCKKPQSYIFRTHQLLFPLVNNVQNWCQKLWRFFSPLPILQGECVLLIIFR